MNHKIIPLLASLALQNAYAKSDFVLPIIGTKQFDVSIHPISLTDVTRNDPFTNNTKPRSIMASIFAPISNCQSKDLQPYMSPVTAQFQDDKFAPYGLPNGSFQALHLESCYESANSNFNPCSRKQLPLVIFSGALATSRLIYSSMLQNIAAAGYHVISVDHPYDSDIVEFPDGTVITGVNITSDADLESAINTRSDDIRFIIQQIRNSSIGTENILPCFRHQRAAEPQIAVIGHSFGGAAAADVMLQDLSVKAAIDIDGTLFGRVLTTGLNRSFVLIGHENKTQETDPSWKTVWPLLNGWKKEFEVEGTAHYSFSDLPLVTAVLGLQDKLPKEVGEVLGTVEGHRMTELLVRLVTAVLDRTLKSGSAEELAKVRKDFPEVVKVA